MLGYAIQGVQLCNRSMNDLNVFSYGKILLRDHLGHLYARRRTTHIIISTTLSLFPLSPLPTFLIAKNKNGNWNQSELVKKN